MMTLVPWSDAVIDTTGAPMSLAPDTWRTMYERDVGAAARRVIAARDRLAEATISGRPDRVSEHRALRAIDPRDQHLVASRLSVAARHRKCL